jgi:Aldo/keto reductase family
MAIQMTRQTTSKITRRDLAALAGGLLVSTGAFAETETPLLTRAIPGSSERIPAVGLGTAYVFDENNEATRSKADAVVQALFKSGGRLIDTATTYGDAESMLGEVTTTAGLRDKLFIATKLESTDPQELKRSLARLRTASRSAAAPQRQEQAAISPTIQGVEETRYVPLYWHHFDVPP